MNAEVILAAWAIFWMVAIAALIYANAGQHRRDAEEQDRRRLRNELLNYRRHNFNGDEE
jgi:hypothetical protein